MKLEDVRLYLETSQFNKKKKKMNDLGLRSLVLKNFKIKKVVKEF